MRIQMNINNDPYNLNRFIDAQNKNDIYEKVSDNLCSNEDMHDSIWYIFPQMSGLGISFYCEKYGIRSRKEAEAYMKNEILRKRLIEISEKLYKMDTDDAKSKILEIEFYRIRSCMTLFSIVSPEYDIFSKNLDKHFSGKECKHTIKRLLDSDAHIIKMNNFIIENLLFIDSERASSKQDIINTYNNLINSFTLLNENQKKSEIIERLSGCNNLLDVINSVMDSENETLMTHAGKNKHMDDLDKLFSLVVSLEYEMLKMIESRDLLLFV